MMDQAEYNRKARQHYEDHPEDRIQDMVQDAVNRKYSDFPDRRLRADKAMG